MDVKCARVMLLIQMRKKDAKEAYEIACKNKDHATALQKQGAAQALAEIESYLEVMIQAQS